MSKYKNIVNYINTFENGSEIARKDLISRFEDTKTSLTTTDYYKHILELAGFIVTVRPGLYKKLKSIPDVSSRSIRKFGNRHHLWMLVKDVDKIIDSLTKEDDEKNWDPRMGGSK